jgi:hypothetical protein
MESKSREAFEAELVKWWPQAEGNMARDGDDYANQFMNYAWWGWQKSRAALVVEEWDFDTFSPHDCGDDAVWMTEIKRTLGKVGITVKGEGDGETNVFPQK